jgi:hypothetical protein
MTERVPNPSDNMVQRAAQWIHDGSYGMVTASNVIDVAAGVGLYTYAPDMDTAVGYGMTFACLMADFVDGSFARYLKTTSWLGEYLDHVGDKPKAFYSLYHAHKLGLTNPPLVAAVAGYNMVTMTTSIVDAAINRGRTVSVDETARKANLGSLLGTGIYAGGVIVAKERPLLGSAIRTTGAALTAGSLAVWGVPNAARLVRGVAQGERRWAPAPE